MRICADSPLLDIRILKKLINISKTCYYDIITNVHPRSFPKGQSVEILKKKVFMKNFHLIKSNYDKEHVTTYFYKHSKNFKLKNLFYKKNYSKMNLSVDTLNDLKRIRKIDKIIKKKYNSNFTLENLIAAC